MKVAILKETDYDETRVVGVFKDHNVAMNYIQQNYQSISNEDVGDFGDLRYSCGAKNLNMGEFVILEIFDYEVCE